VNKSDLVAKVAADAGITKDQANSAVTAMINAIAGEVAKGKPVRIPGFGTFERRDRKKRQAVNPQTKKKITIPARKVPAFKPGSLFKEVVANPSKASKLLVSKPAAKPAAKRAAAAKKSAPKKAAPKKASRPAAKPAAQKKASARKAAGSKRR
jgi:DNA-binding protein HU-beta